MLFAMFCSASVDEAALILEIISIVLEVNAQMSTVLLSEANGVCGVAFNIQDSLQTKLCATYRLCIIRRKGSNPFHSAIRASLMGVLFSFTHPCPIFPSVI